jgi:CRP-like cAMP-binding protein
MPFLAVLDDEPALARRMLEIATQRLFRSQRRESALAFLGAPARVARVLLEMDEADKRGPDKGFITLSQEELAQRTGLARQTVSGSLGQWRQNDWLLTGRGRIMLLNRAALRRIAEESLL